MIFLKVNRIKIGIRSTLIILHINDQTIEASIDYYLLILHKLRIFSFAAIV